MSLYKTTHFSVSSHCHNLEEEEMSTTTSTSTPLEFNAFSWHIDDNTPADKIASVHIFGKTFEGKSVCVHTIGFQPTITIRFTDPNVVLNGFFQDTYSEAIRSRLKKWDFSGDFPEVEEDFGEQLVSVDIVKKKSIWGFSFSKSEPFLQLSFSSIQAYDMTLKLLKSIQRNKNKTKLLDEFIGEYESLKESKENTYDYIEAFSDEHKIDSKVLRFLTKIYQGGLPVAAMKIQLFDVVDSILRFSHQRDIKLAGWIKVSKYQQQLSRTTTCDIEVSARYENLIPVDNDSICAHITEMAFDIESYSFDGDFPLPTHPMNYVYQIGITLKRYKDNDMKRFLLHFKTPTEVKQVKENSGECMPIDNVEVFNFKTEKALLLFFAEFIQTQNPDIIYGYNSDNFDWNYLVERAKITKCYTKFMKTLSKINGYECTLEEQTFTSSAYGDNRYLRVAIPGRLNIDLLIWIQRNMPQDQYPNHKLDTIAEIEVGEKKRDVSAHDIFQAFRTGDPQKCTVIGDYCVQVSKLYIYIISKQIN